MEKSETALKTIGEMAKALGVQTHILRYWEEHFTMLNPLKRAGGRRYYRSEDAALLHKINLLIYDKGFTIKGAQKYLRDAKKSDKNTAGTDNNNVYSAPITQMSNKPMSDDIKRQLQAIADELRKAIAA